MSTGGGGVGGEGEELDMGVAIYTANAIVAELLESDVYVQMTCVAKDMEYQEHMYIPIQCKSCCFLTFMLIFINIFEHVYIHMHLPVPIYTIFADTHILILAYTHL
ncbi:hypothetical protein EON65_48500 [archaeon]|nr:MAG: hypothetical protein EON65_48500 [archaeon]